MKSIESTGKTIEDAIQNGLAQLGVDRDSTSVEVLENPKSGFLGFGGSPARVRITVTEVEDDPLFSSPVSIPPAEAKPESVGQAPAEEAARPAAQKPVQGEAETPAVSETHTQDTSAAPAERSVEDRIQYAKEFLETLLEKMHSPAVATPVLGEDGYLHIDLSGSDMGLVIGRRGETLDALQHITSFAINQGQNHPLRVFLDTENYRARREESLRGLARKTASKVVKYRRNLSLEPMNAYERHVIHEALQDWRDVSTASTGTEPNRRVVVQYTPHR